MKTYLCKKLYQTHPHHKYYNHLLKENWYILTDFKGSLYFSDYYLKNPIQVFRKQDDYFVSDDCNKIMNFEDDFENFSIELNGKIIRFRSERIY